jgi:hypothetical protein
MCLFGIGTGTGPSELAAGQIKTFPSSERINEVLQEHWTLLILNPHSILCIEVDFMLFDSNCSP